MKKLPPKERPTWCSLRPLSWNELVSSTDVPLWFELRKFEHLNQWCLVDTDEITGKVLIITKNGTYDIQEKYGEDYMCYSPLPIG